MSQIYSDAQTEISRGLDQLRCEITALRELLAARSSYRTYRNVKYQLTAARFQIALIRHAHICRKAGFNPDQPRVPRGNPDGGQWTADGGGAIPSTAVSDSLVGEADITSSITSTNVVSISDSRVVSDANPDPIIPGARYTQTQIVIKPSAVTNDTKIDTTTTKLTTILGHAMDVVEPTFDVSPQEYGRLVHEKFADTVRVLGLPGIGYDDVETTFGGSYYGAKGSVRTEVILRDDAAQVIAIYDVKTGNATIGAARAAELRTKVGVDNTVPIIELQAIHGVDRKGLISRATANNLQSHRTF